MKAGRRIGHGVVFLVIAVSCWGCQDSLPAFAVEVVEAHRTSPPLLLSEVQQAAQPADLLDADFVLRNRTSSPQPVSLAGKSCSCYGVMLDGDPWETGETMTVPAGAERLLRFDVKPPIEPAERSWSVRLSSDRLSNEQPSSGEVPSVEQVLTLGVRVYDDVTLQPEVFFLTLPAASSSRAAASTAADGRQEAATGNGAPQRLVIRLTWRSDDSSSSPPQIIDLPAWASFSPPVANGAPEQIALGLWQQSWETHLEFNLAQPNVTRSSVRKSLAAHSADHNREPTHPTGNLSVPRAGPSPDLQQATIRPGIHRFHVALAGSGDQTARVAGRIVLKKSPGVLAPSVVHWGQISERSSRKRRLVLAAGDDRTFRIKRVSLLDVNPPSAAVSPSPLDNSASRPLMPTGVLTHRLVSSLMNLTVSMDQEEAGVRQSVALELVPLQAGPLDTTLVFETDHPLTPTLNVRLRAVVLEATSGTTIPSGG